MPKNKIFDSLLVACLLLLGSPNGFAQENNCQPQIDVASLLNKVSVDGVLHIGQLYARCLPMPTKKSQTAYEYHPYDGGKLSADLKDSRGQTVNTFVWYGNDIQSIWELDRYEVVGGHEALKKLQPGNYSLDFAIEDKVFQKFPFSVSTKESKDQFKPQTLYLLDGQWRDYASFYAPDVNRFFQLVVWLRDADNLGEHKKTQVPVGLRLVRDKDKALIAEGDEDYTVLLDHKWHSFTLSFRRPGAGLRSGNYSEFKLSEVVAVDGNYTIELSVGGKPYSSYKLAVKNGMINNIDLAQLQKERYRILIPLTANRR